MRGTYGCAGAKAEHAHLREGRHEAYDVRVMHALVQADLALQLVLGQGREAQKVVHLEHDLLCVHGHTHDLAVGTSTMLFAAILGEVDLRSVAPVEFLHGFEVCKLPLPRNDLPSGGIGRSDDMLRWLLGYERGRLPVNLAACGMVGCGLQRPHRGAGLPVAAVHPKVCCTKLNVDIQA